MAPREPLIPCYEHPDFWVFDKPAEVSFHSERGSGFFAELQHTFPNETLFPVHRLDKLTSGLLIAARNKSAAAQFQQLFANKKINKTYLALSTLKPTKKQGWIKGDMAKSRGGNWKLTRELTDPAITQFTSYSLAEQLRLFILQPHTGRTHQLRVAMKSLASPILGDTRYGAATSDRGYLHAAQLQFDWNGAAIAIEQLPQTGQHFLKHLSAIRQCLHAHT